MRPGDFLIVGFSILGCGLGGLLGVMFSAATIDHEIGFRLLPLLIGSMTGIAVGIFGAVKINAHKSEPE